MAEVSLDRRLHYWARLFADGAIPNKFPYELRENAKFYRGWEAGEVLKAAVQSDMKRIFRRKDVTLSDEEKKRVEDYIDLRLYGHRDIERLSDELVIAQWIGFGIRQVKGGDR